MYRTILVPLDGSDFAERALDCALPLARRADATIELLYVSDLSVLNPPMRPHSGPWTNAFHARQEDYLRGVARRLERDGANAVRSALVEGVPAHVIAEHARERGCDLIVMTSHGRGGLERAWLGSVTTAVLREAHAPVLVVRAGDYDAGANGWAPGTIVAAVDESELAERALEHGARIAGMFEAELVLVEVAPPWIGPASPYLPHAAEMVRESRDERIAAVREYLDATERRLADRVPPIRRVRSVIDEHGGEARGILRAAKDADADLIVLGTHGLGTLRRVLIGSVADKVLRAADRPVLVVRAADET
jgi:nucleotide-binding universal stress UspA family protein